METRHLDLGIQVGNAAYLKPPFILANDINHRLARFIQISGKEFITTTHVLDGRLHLWDIVKGTAIRLSYSRLHHLTSRSTSPMQICVTDDTTLGYAEILCAEQRFRIYLVNTEAYTESRWLSSIFELNSILSQISDICYIRMADGTHAAAVFQWKSLRPSCRNDWWENQTAHWTEANGTSLSVWKHLRR